MSPEIQTTDAYTDMLRRRLFNVLKLTSRFGDPGEALSLEELYKIADDVDPLLREMDLLIAKYNVCRKREAHLNETIFWLTATADELARLGEKLCMALDHTEFSQAHYSDLGRLIREYRREKTNRTSQGQIQKEARP